MKSHWIDALLRRRAVPGGGSRLPRELRVRLLLLILMVILLFMGEGMVRRAMTRNLVKARVVRHRKVLSRQAEGQERGIRRLSAFFLKSGPDAALEQARTEQMEILVRGLRRWKLDVLTFDSTIQTDGVDPAVELKLAVAGRFPDLVGALDSMAAQRPAWLAREYRIRLQGHDRVRMDGVFRMLLKGEG